MPVPSLVISYHRLPGEAVRALASAGGTAETIPMLRAAQLSRHLLLLKFILASWPTDTTERDASVRVLTEAQRAASPLVADLIGDPAIGNWAVCTARRLRDSPRPGAGLRTDVAHLGALAAAAAARSGVDAELAVTARNGRVALPTLGSARVPLPRGAPARVTVHGGRITVSGGGVAVPVPADPSTDTDRWSGLRHLAADADGIRVRVALDDLDPYRGRHHLRAARRLRNEDVIRWSELFSGAWRLLTRYAPDRARELAAGLTSMVPLVGAVTGIAGSATNRSAFGSFGLTPPTTPQDLAITLVHEFQHSKLNAVLDFVPLCDTAADTYYSPWRTDPRPIGGLLHGAYAFLGVAETWNLLRRSPDLAEAAEHQFATVRMQVQHAVGTLTGAGHLTPAGQRFVAGLAAAADGLLAVPLPAPVVTRARVALRQDHETWQVRNGRGD